MPTRELCEPERILAITELLYAAALEPARWSDALEALKQSVGGTAVSLRVETRSPTDAPMAEPASVQQHWLGFDPAFQKAYFEHYWREDVCSSAWPLNRTGTADTLVPIEVRRRAPFFNDLCVPFELDDLVGGLVESSPTGSIALAIMKPSTVRAFDETHTVLLDHLLPHIRRAVQIGRLLESAESDRALAWEVIDRLAIGFFVIDRAARLKRANRAGERMLGDGLRIGRDGIAAELPSVTRALHECLATARLCHPKARLPGEDAPVLVSRAVALPRRDGLPLSAVAMPVSGLGTPLGLGLGHDDVLLIVTDPSARIEPPPAVLARVYGLTAAETRVALLLGRGLAPKEVANQLGIAWNTVRFQLRQIYAKTHTSGQSALVRLLLLLGLVDDA